MDGTKIRQNIQYREVSKTELDARSPVLWHVSHRDAQAACHILSRYVLVLNNTINAAVCLQNIRRHQRATISLFYVSSTFAASDIESTATRFPSNSKADHPRMRVLS